MKATIHNTNHTHKGLKCGLSYWVYVVWLLGFGALNTLSALNANSQIIHQTPTLQTSLQTTQHSDKSEVEEGNLSDWIKLKAIVYFHPTHPLNWAIVEDLSQNTFSLRQDQSLEIEGEVWQVKTIAAKQITLVSSSLPHQKTYTFSLYNRTQLSLFNSANSQNKQAVILRVNLTQEQRQRLKNYQQQLQKDPWALVNLIRIQSTEDSGGFRVLSGIDRSILPMFHLQSGDQILSINQVDLSSGDITEVDQNKLYQTFSQSSYFMVEVYHPETSEFLTLRVGL